MDFLEGALLGPLWSDTDYATRKHTGFNLLISLVFWACLFFIFYKVNTSGTPWLLREAAPNWVLWAIVLFFVSPFLCLLYYRLPLIGRLPVLALMLCKYLMMYLAVFKWLAPNLEVNFSSALSSLTVFLNDTVGTFIEYYTERYQTSGLFVSATFLLIVCGIIGLLLLLTVCTLPYLYFALLKWFQGVLDDILWIMIDLVNYFVKNKNVKVPKLVQDMAYNAAIVKNNELQARRDKKAKQHLLKR